LAAAAVSIRIAGLALVPAVLVALVGSERGARYARAARRRDRTALAAALGGVVVLIVAGAVAVRVSPYWAHIASVWQPHGGADAYLNHLAIELRQKIVSLGELGSQTNCCVRAPAALWPAYVLLGLAVMGLVVYGWLARRRLGPVEALVLGTAAVVLVYDGGDARFWIAALPFLLAYAFIGARRLAGLRPARYVLGLWAAAFVAIGVVWLVNSVVLTTAGRRFPAVWSREVDRVVENSYRYTFGEAPGMSPLALSPGAVRVLRRYEPLARGGR
jgi:hypothetical protein